MASLETWRAVGGIERVELRFSDDEIAVMIEESHARRRSCHRAAMLEQDLRAIRHHIDTTGGSSIMLVRHEGEWLLRQPPAGSGGSYAFAEFGQGDIETLVSRVIGRVGGFSGADPRRGASGAARPPPMRDDGHARTEVVLGFAGVVRR